MRAAGWWAVACGCVLVLSGCTSPSPPHLTIQSQPASCRDGVVHVFPEMDTCATVSGHLVTAAGVQPPDVREYEVAGLHDGILYSIETLDLKEKAVINQDRLHDFTKVAFSYFTSKMKQHSDKVWDLTDLAQVGDISYVTYSYTAEEITDSVGFERCVTFIRPSNHHQYIYVGGFCQSRMDHALTPDDVTRLVGLIKGPD